MKIKLIKSARESYWYSNLIGQIFEVKECAEMKFSYKLVSKDSTSKYFDKDDVQVLQDTTMFDLTKERWFISTPTIEIYQAVVDWLAGKGLSLHKMINKNEPVNEYGTEACLCGDFDQLTNGIIYGSLDWFQSNTDYKEIKISFKTAVDLVKYPKHKTAETESSKQMKALEDQIQKLIEQKDALKATIKEEF